MKNATLFFYNSASLLECPLWDEKRRLIWCIEIRKCRVFAISPDDHSCRTYTMPSIVGWIGLRPDGKLYVADKEGVFVFDPDNDPDAKALTFVAQPEPDLRFRYNDGHIDPEGRILVGSKGDLERMAGEGGLFVIDTDGSCRKVVSGTTTANGMGFSTDLKQFYFIDTPSKNVYLYDYDHSTGTPENERIFVTLTDGGMPDGMCVLPDGRVCVAEWAGGKVSVFNPDGSLCDTILVPVTNVSSCCPVGNTLYITTAVCNGKDEPTAGGLFAAEL